MNFVPFNFIDDVTRDLKRRHVEKNLLALSGNWGEAARARLDGPDAKILIDVNHSGLEYFITSDSDRREIRGVCIRYFANNAEKRYEDPESTLTELIKIIQKTPAIESLHVMGEDWPPVIEEKDKIPEKHVIWSLIERLPYVLAVSISSSTPYNELIIPKAVHCLWVYDWKPFPESCKQFVIDGIKSGLLELVGFRIFGGTPIRPFVTDVLDACDARGKFERLSVDFECYNYCKENELFESGVIEFDNHSRNFLWVKRKYHFLDI
ncbi:hypothetical protein L596_005410 [Steinernema carpocapsae]|uniref:Uncharacterized protein n=1 Tax=Steinernema carpocapsae TaxID=34508 RepID=A0A4U8UYX7_STECR|nr:hypothetical protein L596_005410 [Steinernema carpocapsae]